jgi:hypothetical protein
MWIEDQVRLWHSRCSNDISDLDATGTIVANYNGKRVLYYGLVVRHPNEGDPAVAVPEMIMSDHSSGNICAFIERFGRDESRIYSGWLTSPRQLNTDYSRAILLAVLKEFNNETLETFLQRAFRIMNRRGMTRDYELTIPHAGCSHFMHIAHRKIKQLARSTENKWYCNSMYSVSLLVNARPLHEFVTILEDIVVCLSCKKQTRMCLVSFRKHSGRVNHMEKESNIDLKDFETEKESVTMQSQEDDIENETKPGNPLVDYFKTKLSNIEKCVEKDSMQAPDALADNRSYSPQLLTFIKKYLTERNAIMVRRIIRKIGSIQRRTLYN